MGLTDTAIKRSRPAEKPYKLADGGGLGQLMFLGSFGEYCIVPDQQAIAVPKEIPFDRACLIGCGVMTGVGAALNVADIGYGDTVLVKASRGVGLERVLEHLGRGEGG